VECELFAWVACLITIRGKWTGRLVTKDTKFLDLE